MIQLWSDHTTRSSKPLTVTEAGQISLVGEKIKRMMYSEGTEYLTQTFSNPLMTGFETMFSLSRPSTGDKGEWVSGLFSKSLVRSGGHTDASKCHRFTCSSGFCLLQQRNLNSRCEVAAMPNPWISNVALQHSCLAGELESCYLHWPAFTSK